MKIKSERKLHALLIGIDEYMPNPWCEALHGAVADVAAMESFLRARDVPQSNLVKLISPGADGPSSDPQARLPTYEAMVQEIRCLGKAAARVGGELLIHYSGHGCRIPTLLPETKGSEGKDEGLVPYNIGQAGGKILRDVELSLLMEELSDLGVPVVLILDACHSGGIVRGAQAAESLLRVRTARFVEPLPTAGPGLFEIHDLEASWRRVHRRAYAKAAPAARRGAHCGAGCDAHWSGIPPHQGLSLLAACRDREVACEFFFEDHPRGALTYTLLAALGEGDRFPHWERLQRRIAQHMRRVRLHQTPVFEGEPSGALLGILRQGASRVLRVLDIDVEKNRLLIDAGQALGLALGATLEVCNKLTLRIEECDASTSWGKPLEGDLTSIEVGDGAQVIDPGGHRRHRVLVVRPTSVPIPSTAKASPPGRGPLRSGLPRAWQLESPAHWLAAVEKELKKYSGGLLERAEEASATRPDFRIVLDSGSLLQIIYPDGLPVPHLPPLRADRPDAAAKMLERLVHLARFNTVRDLDNSDRSSPLHGTVTASLGRLPASFRRGDSLEPVSCVDVWPKFSAGDMVCLSVANNSPRSLNLYVLDLKPDWGIQLVHPRSSLEILSPGEEIRLPFSSHLPPGVRQGTQSFKVLATVKPTNARWLELPPMGAQAPFRGSLRGQPGDPLEDFLSQVVRGGIPRRGSGGRGVSHGWATDRVDFEIVLPPGRQGQT